MKRKIFSKLLMGAFLIASVSMFVSCKDYDDDISKNAKDIATLKAEVDALKSSLASELATAKAELATAIANKADKSDLDKKADISEVEKKADATQLADLQAKVDALQTKVDAINNWASKDDIESLQTALSVLEGKIPAAYDDTQLKADVEAALKLQSDALDAFKKSVSEAGYLTAEDKAAIENELGEKIQEVKDMIANIDPNAGLEEITTKFNALSDKITQDLTDAINVMEMLVTKKLTSIVLKPAFYWEGIEAIETPYLKTPEFAENGAYDFQYQVTGYTEGDDVIKVHVDKVMAWLATDGTKLCSETLKTWDPYFWNRKPAGTSSTAYTYFSLIEQDGTALAASEKKTLQYVVIAPNAEAQYHINPSTADLSNIEYSFFQNTSEVYTRADGPSIKATPIADKITFDKGILTVPFSVDYPTVWNYFAKWAFDNNTYAYWQDNSDYWDLYDAGNEPEWDDAHFNDYVYINWQTGTAIDAAGNEVNIITDIQRYYYGTKASAYGSSNYWDNNGNFVQQVAPLPFISLTAAAQDTTINSDYAVVVPATYTIVALADNNPNVTLDRKTFVNNHQNIMNSIRDNHLYETVGVNGTYDFIGETANRYTANSPGAIPSPATHDVGYRDTIDLEPFIETHYSYTTYTRYGQSTVDKVMSKDLMKKLGLHYEFKEIDYTIGKNVTSESQHIQHIGDAKSGKFAPRSVDVTSGKRIDDQEAGREVIDREPLVRVDLVTEDGKIVRYGYIKLRITEAKESYDDIDVEFELSDYYMNCGDQMRLTWYQVEAGILAKLNGGKGMTKYEFERNYYFVNEGGWTDMPNNAFGRLYNTASANKYYGTRWYRKDGKIVEAANATTEADAVNNYDYTKWNEDNNWFGRVWYTPHDNATESHSWDEQTNVIIWDLHGYNEEESAGVPYRGNMKDLYAAPLFQKLMSVSGASYESKGLSTKAISTIVRFKNKNNDTYVNVKLTIPVGKLHFAYGAVDNKDWSHWFQFCSADEGVKDTEKPYWKEFDAHINPFKPSNNGYRYLDVTSYNQLLTDNWLDPTRMVVMEETNKFTKFNAPTAPVVSFIFTYPIKDVNSKDVSASTIKLDGVDFFNAWNVRGASGTVWTLQVRAHAGIDNTAIFAVGKNGHIYGPEEVCYLDDQLVKGGVIIAQNNRIHYHGLETAGAPNLYPAATDLVNLVGAYDEKGNPRFDLAAGLTYLRNAEYLDNNIDKTFTAYLNIQVAHDLCYDPLIGKNNFNIRVHRPINVVGKEYLWDDRVLADNRLAIKDLVEIVDWNRFPVVAAGSKKIAERNTMFGIEQPAYETVYNDAVSMKQTNAGIPYEYYGISELAVRYDEIRTDHAKQPAVRANKYYENDQIVANTDLVKNLNSLTSWRETNLKTLSLLNADGSVVPFDVAHAYNHSDLNATGTGTRFGWLYYNNNASVVQEFHIYVPIAVKYNWGNIAYDYLLDQPGVKLDKDYTQTVWAIITVKGTH